MDNNILRPKQSVTYFRDGARRVDRARTHMSDERNFAVGDAETPPRALQTSECNELLDPTRKSCLILFQRQPGKLLLEELTTRHAMQECCDAVLILLDTEKGRRLSWALRVNRS